MRLEDNDVDYNYLLMSYEDASNNDILVMPIGSIEQHCRAPVGTDYLIALAVSRSVCDLLRNNGGYSCALLPGMPFGYSPEWASCPGTITLSLETFKLFLIDILNSILNTNIKYFIIINGHGGNSTLAEAVLREWASKHKKPRTILINYWEAANIQLGHCDPIEEKLLSQVLGKEVSCSCWKELFFSPKGAKTLRLPSPSCGLGGRIKNLDSNKINISKISEKIYFIILKLINNKKYIL